MNNTEYQTAPQKAVRAKFKGRKRIRSRYAPRYPSTAEREFRRMGRVYARNLQRPVKKQLSVVMKAYRRQVRGDAREDGIFDFIALVHEVVVNIATEISLALEEMRLREQIEKYARMVQNRSAKEWIASVRAAFGVELIPPSYEGDSYEQVIQQWIAKNLAYLEGMPLEMLLSIEAVIGSAYRERMDPDLLELKLQKQLNAMRVRAEYMARDGVASLNAGLMKMYQTEAGVNRYVWKSMRDANVRDCHSEFDGHIYSWDNPPEDWYYTKSMGRVYTGECFNPGEAYGCRCCAVPVFERDTFNMSEQK